MYRFVFVSVVLLNGCSFISNKPDESRVTSIDHNVVTSAAIKQKKTLYESHCLNDVDIIFCLHAEARRTGDPQPQLYLGNLYSGFLPDKNGWPVDRDEKSACFFYEKAAIQNPEEYKSNDIEKARKVIGEAAYRFSLCAPFSDDRYSFMIKAANLGYQNAFDKAGLYSWMPKTANSKIGDIDGPGNPELAQKYFEMALKYEHDAPNAIKYCGDVYMKLGQKDKSEACQKEVMRRAANPNKARREIYGY